LRAIAVNASRKSWRPWAGREDAIFHCQLVLESSLVEEDTLRG